MVRMSLSSSGHEKSGVLLIQIIEPRSSQTKVSYVSARDASAHSSAAIYGTLR